MLLIKAERIAVHKASPLHPSFFVCRRHDDQKRYYELKDGDPPYAARFYDCCGMEDPDAPGCATGFHISYDDPDEETAPPPSTPPTTTPSKEPTSATRTCSSSASASSVTNAVFYMSSMSLCTLNQTACK